MKPATDIPPHNLDAEHAVLGAVLLEGRSVLIKINEHLRRSDFYKDAHRTIYDAMQRLLNRGEPMDLITVAEELRGSAELDFVGGAAALALLAEQAAIAPHLMSYLSIVRDMAVRRELIQTSTHVVEQAFEARQDVRKLVTDAGEQMHALKARLAPAWPEPSPVPNGLLPVPMFDADMLPAVLAPWVMDIAERAQCPPDFVAVGAVVAAAAVVGRKLGIRPKQRDDWVVVPNLWGIAIGHPGIMKSPALAEALKPLNRLIANARIEHEKKMAEHDFQMAEQEARRKARAKQLTMAIEKGEPTEDLRHAFEGPLYSAPTERRYVLNDSTVEKLGELLNQNPNGLLLFRDEMNGFLRTMDRQGHENDRAFFCEAWNGTNSYTYDRIARGTLHIKAACISILGGIQPGPLHEYLHEVSRRGGGDDGLIQRFQLAVYPDGPHEWTNVDRWPNREAKANVVEVYQRLDALDPASVGAEELTPEELPFLRFSADAQRSFNRWRAQLQAKLLSDDEHPVIVSHLSKYRSLMPSLALLFHLIDYVMGESNGPVSGAAALRAVAWCDYLEAHARRIYQTVTASARWSAQLLANKVKAGKLSDPFTLRDVYRKEWTGLSEAKDLLPALDLLEELHWLRHEEVGTTERGGRPTVQYHINPHIGSAAL